MRPSHDSDSDEPESLNQVINEVPPLTNEERRQRGLPPLWSPYADEGWGAPTTGGWDIHDTPPPPEPEPDGALGLVRTDPAALPANALPIQGVAIRLTGDAIAQSGWDRWDEIMLPFPSSFFDSDTWPHRPGTFSVWTYKMTPRSKEHLRAFLQMFAWFPRPCSIEGGEEKVRLWTLLLDRVLAETSGPDFDPIAAAANTVDFARSILPGEVWKIVVHRPGYGQGFGWANDW